MQLHHKINQHSSISIIISNSDNSSNNNNSDNNRTKDDSKPDVRTLRGRVHASKCSS
jgi:hypothetical protein